MLRPSKHEASFFSNLLGQDPRSKKFDGIVPQDLAFCLIGNGLGVEIRERSLRIDGVRVWVVGVPDDVLAFKVVYHILERALVAVARNQTLTHEVLAGKHP